ncbi:MAG: P-loop NTPase, partial [Myxococcales bacterium]|nr:P-loop NTPase [Myxococcales bacterium]
MDDVEILSEPGSPRVLAISGAKGGVGKTLLATNLAIYFATVGRRVVFVDADSSGANGHTFLGLQPAVAVEGTPGRAVETSIPGLSYLRVGVDQPVPGSHRTTPMRSLADLVLRLDADYAVVDLGSGIRGHALALWRHAEVGLFVSVPEPTSVEDTYRFLRRAFAQGLLEAMADRDARLRMRAELRAMGNFPSPTDLLRR